MKLQIRPFLLILALLSVPLGKAQTGSSDSSQSGSTESSPQAQSSNGPQPVFAHPQNSPPLGFLDEVTSHNFIKLGLGASVAYDTNEAGFSPQSYSQTLAIFSPSVQLTQTRPKLTWNIGAFGGLTTSSTPGYYSSANRSAQAGFIYQISDRWQLVGSENYLYASDPFQQYTVYSGTPTYNQPNPTVYNPLATTESNYANIDLSYQMSAHDSLIFTGTETLTQYANGVNSNTNSLFNSYSWGGLAQYQHFFSPRLSAGGGYSFTAVDFGHGQSRSGIQSIQAFATYKFSPHMSLTGWLGPQYTANKNLVPIFCTRYGCLIEQFHNASWSSAFGGNFSWSGQRNSVRLSFSKSIQNGGILLGVVQLYQVNSLYMRQLTPRWTGNLGVLYGNNTGRSTRLQAQHLNSITGYASLVRQLTPALSASVSYTYLYQTQQHLYYAVTPKWIDNHFQFTLQYYWGHSLGR